VALNLRRVFRQRDMAFVTMLNELRVGVVSPATLRAVAASGSKVDAIKRVRERERDMIECICDTIGRCYVVQERGVQPSRLFAKKRRS